MERIQWEIDRDHNTIVEMDGDTNIVLYYDTIPTEIIVCITNMWNAGESLEAIGHELDKINGLTLDEADKLMEQMKEYVKVTEDEERQNNQFLEEDISSKLKQSTDSMERSNVATAMNDSKAEHDRVMGNAGMVTAEGEVLVKAPETGIGKPEGVPIVTSEGQKTTTKRTRTATPAGNGKGVSAASVRNSLRMQAESANEKLLLIDYIEELSTSKEFPTGLRKDYTDLLIKFTKAIEQVKSEYILSTQEL